MVTIVASSPSGRADGIGDYAAWLGRALVSQGTSATVTVWTRWADIRPQVAGGVLLIQYLPQAFVTTSFPGLLACCRRWRQAGGRVVVTFHELWVPADGPVQQQVRYRLYRWAVRRLLTCLDGAVVTGAVARAMLTEVAPAAPVPVIEVPVGPGIVPHGLATAPQPGVVVMFGQPAAMHRDALRALGRWLPSTPDVTLVWCGRDVVEMRALWCGTLGLAETGVTFEGGLAADALSQRLREATVAVAPYVDGVSFRRSSLATLLAHDLPVVGLDGPSTEAEHRSSGAFMLCRVDEADRLPAALGALLADAHRRETMSRAVRTWSRTRQSWEVIAGQYGRFLEALP